MASLMLDNASRRYFVRFRYGGRSFKRSLKTGNPRLAEGALARLEETLHLLRTGRIAMPPTADPVAFLLSGGRVDSTAEPKLLSLAELVATFQERRVPGAKEANTCSTEDLHLRHLVRVLGGSTIVQTITRPVMQRYVEARLREKTRGRHVSPDTVHKEVATFRVLWNWSVDAELLDRAAPVTKLVYPKRDEKLPFMTRREIETIIARGGLSQAEVTKLWECLYLNRHEVHQILEHVRTHAKFDFIYPLVCFIAHTGVRLSEAVRSRIDDIDLVNRQAVIREKKRSRVRATTYRRVELTSQLQDVLTQWFAIHPGGQFTFVKGGDLRRLDPGELVSLTKHMARKHLALTLAGSDWSILRGFHVFRHSFASNLAAAGVDQRIIDEWMGHQTDEMRRRYRHLVPEVRRQAIEQLLPQEARRVEGGMSDHEHGELQLHDEA